MTRRRRSAVATSVLFACTAPFGIVAHLLSEVVGLGWQDDESVLFSARHAYLAIIALVSLTILGLALRSVRADNRRRCVSEIVDALPFRGRGARFVVLSFVLQFGFFAVTQIGEGCPLCGGDVFVGIVAAAAAALIGSLIVAFAKRRIVDLAMALLWFATQGLQAPKLFGDTRREQHAAAARSARRAPFFFRYRPPPVAD